MSAVTDRPRLTTPPTRAATAITARRRAWRLGARQCAITSMAVTGGARSAPMVSLHLRSRGGRGVGIELFADQIHEGQGNPSGLGNGVAVMTAAQHGRGHTHAHAGPVVMVGPTGGGQWRDHDRS